MKHRLEKARLYLVADLDLLGTRDVSHAVRDAIAGGTDIVQIRAKGYEDDLVEEIVRILLQITRPAGVPLIINDLVQIAKDAGADGAHVGRRDMPLAEARAILGPDSILGVSVGSLAEAETAEREGADYLGLGAVFPTQSKPGTEVVGLKCVAQIERAVSIPVFCIGGIDTTNVRSLIDAGGRRIAVIGAVLNTQDIRAAAAELKTALDAVPGPGTGA